MENTDLVASTIEFVEKHLGSTPTSISYWCGVMYVASELLRRQGHQCFGLSRSASRARSGYDERECFALLALEVDGQVIGLQGQKGWDAVFRSAGKGVRYEKPSKSPEEDRKDFSMTLGAFPRDWLLRVHEKVDGLHVLWQAHYLDMSTEQSVGLPRIRRI